MSDAEERLRVPRGRARGRRPARRRRPVSEIVDRAPAECCRALGLDRCVLSRIDDGALVAEAVHVADGDAAAVLAALREAPVRLGYPLIEAEMLRRRRAAIVPAPEDADAAARHAFAGVMGWGEHLAAPVVLEGRVIGFLHGDRAAPDARSSPPTATASDDSPLAFADIFERAVLRRRLRVQRQELRQVASWADARTSELSDGAIDLAARARRARGDEPVRRAGRRTRRCATCSPAASSTSSSTWSGRDERRHRACPRRLRGHGEVPRQEHPAQAPREQPAEATSRYLRLSLRRDDRALP
jgi:hypothetical protein